MIFVCLYWFRIESYLHLEVPGDERSRAQGNTALHLAAREGHSALVEKLISAGASVDTNNNFGQEPRRVCGS